MMPFLLRNVRLDLEDSEDRLPFLAAKRLRVDPQAIRAWAVVRRSVDARKKDDIHFVYHLEVALHETQARERAVLKKLRPDDAAWLEPEPHYDPDFGARPLPHRPLVVGFGPGGMFAALRLAELGYRPVVLERGRPVRQRHRDIMQRFYRLHEFDPTSNLLYGEGGAGTYSDGKLYTRVHSPLVRTVLEKLYQHGADPDILLDAHPHIGSDRLPTICTRLRERILALGGEVRFESALQDIRIQDGALTAVQINGAWEPCGPVVLAVGHSARDTIRMLAGRGVRIEAKPFQLGVRIEHPQEMVDRWQYGACAGHRRLAPAEYWMVAKGAAGERADLFSFCMCPGGVILPTNESAGLVATNGASRARRGSGFANSGFVLTLDPGQMKCDALAALAYQERWERLAYQATGGSYRVPAQRAEDFLAGRSSDGACRTSYPLGGQWCDIRAVVPELVVEALTRGLPALERKFPGIAGPDTLITAPETRASAPIRITRDEMTRCAVGIADLYPVGEGAGYAGGIISAAIDGIKTADAIITTYAPP